MRTVCRTLAGSLALVLLIGLGGSSAASARIVYTANEDADEVAVVDTAMQLVVKRIAVGDEPIDLAFTPDGGRLYVANNASNDVSVIDTQSRTVIATINVGTRPMGIAITPDGSRAYVANFAGDSVSVIDTAMHAVVETLTSVIAPADVVISPDGERAYVISSFGNALVVDTATDTVVGDPIALGSEPSWAAITPDGTRAYVSNFTGNTVSVIDIAANSVTATISSGSSPARVAITPDGSRAYVASMGDNEVRVIDTATNSIVDTIEDIGVPGALAIAPDGRTAYVGDNSDGSLIPIDTATNEPGPAIEVEVTQGPVIAAAVAPNQPPVAKLSAPAVAYAGVPVAFDASGSTDDLGIRSYTFGFGDGSSVTSPTPTRTHAYSKLGTYEATVTVDDGEGCDPLPQFYPPLASPFTGKTAYCNGPSAVISAPIEIRVEPVLRATANRRQRSLRRIAVRVTCRGTECAVGASGRLVVRGGGAKGGFRLGERARALTKGARAKLALAIPAAARKAARKALRGGGSVRARVRVLAAYEGTLRQVETLRVRIVR